MRLLPSALTVVLLCSASAAAAASFVSLLASRASQSAPFAPPTRPTTIAATTSAAHTPAVGGRGTATALGGAAPKRLEENVDGVLYVNDRCINCAACSNFAPDVFMRSPSDGAHVVHTQPDLNDAASLDRARAALAACPVAAIRVEGTAQRNHRNKGDRLSEEEETLAKRLAINPNLNGLEVPFPRSLLRGDCDSEDDSEDDDADAASDASAASSSASAVHYLGHHNEKSFGATPYLVTGKDDTGRTVSVMVDTPKFTPSSVRAVLSLTGPSGPDYLLLTHIDDTADHTKWREEFPSLKRIFHAGDLGRYNWLNDAALEGVEVLLKGTKDDDDEDGAGAGDGKQLFKMWTLDGKDVNDLDNGEGRGSEGEGDFVILHTPGHSPGSISLLYRSGGRKEERGAGGILFTGDTYAYSTRDGGSMSAFPRYAKDSLDVQIKTLRKFGLMSSEWDVVAPGHGHPRDYVALMRQEGKGERDDENDADRLRRRKLEEIEDAITGIERYRSRFAFK